MRTPDRTRKLLYLRTWDEWRLDNIAKALPPYWQTTFQVMHGMNEVELSDYDVLYFPSAHDQLFMLTQTERVLRYLAAVAAVPEAVPGGAAAALHQPDDPSALPGQVFRPDGLRDLSPARRHSRAICPRLVGGAGRRAAVVDDRGRG